MSEFINGVRMAANGGLDGVSDAIVFAMLWFAGFWQLHPFLRWWFPSGSRFGM